MNPSEVAARIRRHAGKYPADPAGYVRDYLGRTFTPQQNAIARLLLEPPYRVLVRSANNQGKTFAAACLASWFTDSFAPSICLATAPTRSQVRDLFFKEFRRVRPLPYGLLPKDTRFQLAPDHFVHGFTAANADAFQGRHAEHLMLIFDEATGIDREFWSRAETMFGAHQGHSWLCPFNPNDSTSPAFAAEESGLWHVVELSALEHPNVLAELAGLPPPIPSAIRLARVQTRIDSECRECEPGAEGGFEWPPDSGRWVQPLTGEFEAQILGRWPSVASTGVWSPAAVDRCFSRQEIHPDWPAQIGLDVARFGDDKSGLVGRKGVCATHAELHRHADGPELATRCKEVASELEPRNPRSVPITVDDTGGYGGSVIDSLSGWNVVPCNASSKAYDQPRYRNRRAELWMSTRVAADGGGVDLSRLSPEAADALRAELLAARYSFDETGKRRVEPKNQMKQRLGRSPDLADALNLAWSDCG